MKDNRSYYDDFAAWYENERHGGYHALIDQLQVDLAKPLATGRDLLLLRVPEECSASAICVACTSRPSVAVPPAVSLAVGTTPRASTHRAPGSPESPGRV